MFWLDVVIIEKLLVLICWYKYGNFKYMIEILIIGFAHGGLRDRRLVDP